MSKKSKPKDTNVKPPVDEVLVVDEAQGVQTVAHTPVLKVARHESGDLSAGAAAREGKTHVFTAPVEEDDAPKAKRRKAAKKADEPAPDESGDSAVDSAPAAAVDADSDAPASEGDAPEAAEKADDEKADPKERRGVKRPPAKQKD